MEALNFSKNSWHYRLVTKLKVYNPPAVGMYDDCTEYTVGDSADICTYSKAVFWSLILVFSAIITGFLFMSVAVETLLGIYFSILMGQWFFSVLGAFGVIIIATCLSFAIIYAFVTVISNPQKYVYNFDLKVKNNSLISNAYRSWKNKFCLPIKFIE